MLNAALLLLTAMTMTLGGALQEGVDPFGQPELLARGLPYAATLLAILLAHEMGHYLMCVRHGVDASLPYFLPGPPLPAGTFGAFIRIRSRFPDRRALFDVAAAGPWAGFVVAVAATIYGLTRSKIMPDAAAAGGVVLGDSLVMTILTWTVLGADPATVVLDPVAYAGWLGFFVTALNLIPVGQLDGGHVLYAAAGRSPRFLSALLVAFLVWLGFGGWRGWLVWAILIVGLLGLGHPTTDDDRRPLDGMRRLAAAATFVIFVLTFVAEPFKILP
ncbi:MAG TPA: site-2 protease family protein [Candidatus Binatia bacterium]|nr:site-2 protease family protein [Candidatus Binatia bacterium]